MIAGLLEGAAFLAARVQLKLKHEFPEFTGKPARATGPELSRADALGDAGQGRAALRRPGAARRQEASRAAPISTRPTASANATSPADYRLCRRHRALAIRYRRAPNISRLPGALQALGIPVGGDVIAGLRLSLTHRIAARLDDEPSDADSRSQAGNLVRRLPRDRTCRSICRRRVRRDRALRAAVRRTASASTSAISTSSAIRWSTPCPHDCMQQIGFDEDDALFPNDNRVFRGFELLREYFMFPRKFLGFDLTGLARRDAAAAQQIGRHRFRIRRSHHSRLAAAVRAENVRALHGAGDQPVRKDQRPHSRSSQISTNTTSFPTAAAISIRAAPGPRSLCPLSGRARTRCRCARSIRPRSTGRRDRSTGFITPSVACRGGAPSKRKHYGASSDYTGTDMFLSLRRARRSSGRSAVAELSVRALCSNRHLTEHLPVGEGGADFRLLDDTSARSRVRRRPDAAARAGGRAVAQPQRDRQQRRGDLAADQHAEPQPSRPGRTRRRARTPAALREMLSMFADLLDSATERKIRGIRSVDSRPVVRRMRERTGSGAARGTRDHRDARREGVRGQRRVPARARSWSAFSPNTRRFNTFTQTVIRTPERGEIMRWPPRMGTRRPL